jgi:hypothetical protein
MPFENEAYIEANENDAITLQVESIEGWNSMDVANRIVIITALEEQIERYPPCLY